MDARKTNEVPSLYPFGTRYDTDLPPLYQHNVVAAQRMGLTYDPEKSLFVDQNKMPVRNEFFQLL
jgi:hypothetical protein